MPSNRTSLVAVAAVVLAAGAATRFGAAKQNILLGDVVETLRNCSLSDIVVVAGALAAFVTMSVMIFVASSSP